MEWIIGLVFEVCDEGMLGRRWGSETDAGKWDFVPTPDLRHYLDLTPAFLTQPGYDLDHMRHRGKGLNKSMPKTTWENALEFTTNGNLEPDRLVE